MYNSMSKEYFSPLLMVSFPHDVWMTLWQAFVDPLVPPFLEDILSLAALVMVSSNPNEITPLETLVDSIDPVPATYASDLV